MFNPRLSEDLNWWRRDHLENYDKLKEFFSTKSPIKILEIGVCEGRTTLWFINNLLKSADCSIHCIDPGITANGRYNLGSDKRVHLHEDFSKNALVKLFLSGETFDLIYVDGEHNACVALQDILISWRLLRVGGIMVIDDYEMRADDPPSYPSYKLFQKYPRLNFIHPRVAIDAFITIFRGQYELFVDNYQVGVKKIVEL